MRRLGTLTLLLCLGTSGLRAEEPNDLAARLVAASPALIECLEAHAAWCAQKKAYGKRDEAYERLLEWAPEHEEARRWLRYERDDHGLWRQRSSYRRPTNPSKAVIQEADTTLATLIETWRRAQVAACLTADDLNERLAAERRLAALLTRFPAAPEIAEAERRTLILLYRDALEAGLLEEVKRLGTRLGDRWPLDIEVRATLGEVVHNDVWLLAESARTLRDASGLRGRVAAALEQAAAQVTSSAPTQVEAGIDLPWAQAYAAPAVRTAGTAGAPVLSRLATLAEAAGPVLDAVLGAPSVRRAGFTAYAFAEPEHLDRFLAAYPVVANATLEHRTSLQLSLVWADGRTMAIDGVLPVGQYDLCVNTLLNQLLSDSLLDGADLAGWQAEGIVRYLAYLMTGTRFSVQMSTDRYAGGETAARAVPASEDAWLMAALKLTESLPQLDLLLLLGKGLDALTAPDATLAYAFSIYLIEGHPGLLRPFLLSVHKSANADKAAREILGMPMSIVEHRFRRWLSEVATPGANER